jgi:hypothetical protein
MSQRQGFRVPTSALTLDYPMSLAVYEHYEQAQKAVDFLSDHEFPVQNCLIVGTELKQIERVTGRLTTGKVALGGLLSGLWLGLFVGLIVSLFGTGSALAAILSTMLFGAVFGLAWALVGYAATRIKKTLTGSGKAPKLQMQHAIQNELGLDHNETRSWHGWHRHVSLVMLAFAMLAAIRLKANMPAPPKSSLPMIRRSRR